MKFICTLCNYILEEVQGLPEAGIEPGTKFDSLPDSWHCPDCAAELKAMKSGKEISETEPSKRESDAKVITAVKKKIAKKIVKTVESHLSSYLPSKYECDLHD